MIVVKPILPHKFENIFMRSIKAEADKIANDILFDFEQTTQTWEHPVKFEKIVEVRPDRIAILVATDDPIYGYVDKGTKPHDIEAKPGHRLMFMTSGFKAKSQPNKLASGNGVKAGPPMAAPMVVHHPGTEARNFSKNIAKIWQKRLRQRVDPVLKRAAKQSGHAR